MLIETERRANKSKDDATKLSQRVLVCLQVAACPFLLCVCSQLTCYSTGEKNDFNHVKENFGPRDLDANLKKMISFMKNMLTYFLSVGSKRSQSHEPRDLDANLSPSEVSMRENN